MNEAANDSAWVSGQDRKKPPALGTNQIAGFGGFLPLASLEKNKQKKKKERKKKTRELQARFRPEVALCKGIWIPGSRKLLLVLVVVVFISSQDKKYISHVTIFE